MLARSLAQQSIVKIAIFKPTDCRFSTIHQCLRRVPSLQTHESQSFDFVSIVGCLNCTCCRLVFFMSSRFLYFSIFFIFVFIFILFLYFFTYGSISFLELCYDQTRAVVFGLVCPSKYRSMLTAELSVPWPAGLQRLFIASLVWHTIWQLHVHSRTSTVDS